MVLKEMGKLEGIFFYWLFWLFWIFTTFFMEKTTKRLYYSIFLLVSILFSTCEITFFSININVTVIIFVVVGYLLLDKKKWFNIFYLIGTGILCTMVYVSFRLFQLYDPVWVMKHPTVKLAIILFVLTAFLVKKFKNRLAIIFIITFQSEFVYSLYIKERLGGIKVGSLEVFDLVAITVFFNFVWYCFEQLILWLDKLVKDKYVTNPLDSNNLEQEF